MILNLLNVFLNEKKMSESQVRILPYNYIVNWISFEKPKKELF